jgi:ankyrin repeat protein
MFWPLGCWEKLNRKEGRWPARGPSRREEPSTQSALQVAVKDRQTHVARILIAAGADVSPAGKALLSSAVYHAHGPVSIELVDLLIKSGAKIDACPTILHDAIRGMDGRVPTSKEVVELLLRAGADATAPTKSGVTPLAELLSLRKCNERAALVRMLLQVSDALPDHPEDGSLIGLAASRDEPDVLRLLIEAGADVNRVDRGGAPLHRAARNGLHQNIEILLAAGADPWSADSAGCTAIDCISPQLLEALRILEEHAGRSRR